jgi:hypothetical protein
MKINTKRFAMPGFLFALLFATAACGGYANKPIGGLDVSALSPALLSVSPIIAGTEREPATADAENPADEKQLRSGHSTIDIHPSAPQGRISPEVSGSTINN